MDTFLWRYTHPRDGRVTTKDDVTEAEALRIFPDAERVEGCEVTAERRGHIGWGFSSAWSGARTGDGARRWPADRDALELTLVAGRLRPVAGARERLFSSRPIPTT